MMPTPAGTNNSDKCCNNPAAVLLNTGSHLGRSSNSSHSSAMPSTGPGTGQASARTTISPSSCSVNKAAKACSITAFQNSKKSRSGAKVVAV